MLQSKTLPRNDRTFLDMRPSRTSHPRKQRQLMIAALVLLVIALGSVVYHDRDFWFPNELAVQDQPDQGSPLAAGTSATQHRHLSARNHKKAQPRSSDLRAADQVEDSGAAPTATRAVLPPMEVEVTSGNTRRILHPGTNSVQIDLGHGSTPPRAASSAPVATKPPVTANAELGVPASPDPTAAGVTNKAAERVEVSSDAKDLVTHSVTPGYPMLARQMKVQGSVILQAVIGPDGLIQDLHVVSGPPILAGAAQQAVKQWHFKPHFQGVEAIETQAKITVNFTISTN